MDLNINRPGSVQGVLVRAYVFSKLPDTKSSWHVQDIDVDKSGAIDYEEFIQAGQPGVSIQGKHWMLRQFLNYSCF